MSLGEAGSRGLGRARGVWAKARWRQIGSLCWVKGQLGLCAMDLSNGIRVKPAREAGGAHSLGDRTAESRKRARPGRGSGIQASNTAIGMK